MAIEIKNVLFDTMQEACLRLEISRATMLRALADGFFTQPPFHHQGRGKRIRYFTDEWYAINEPKLEKARDRK